MAEVNLIFAKAELKMRFGFNGYLKMNIEAFVRERFEQNKFVAGVPRKHYGFGREDFGSDSEFQSVVAYLDQLKTDGRIEFVTKHQEDESGSRIVDTLLVHLTHPGRVWLGWE